MKRRWSEEDARKILEYVSEYGPDRHAIAATLGVGMGQLNNYIDRQISGRYKQASDAFYARMRAQQEVAPSLRFTEVNKILSLPVAPFEVPIPAPAKSDKSKKWFTAVVYGDTHFPFQDDSALRVVLSLIKDVKPDVVLHVGDLIDCWQISRYDKDPARKDSLQDNIDQARAHLHQIAQIAPKARRVLLEGNHESRLSRSIWQMEGAQREFARLRIFQKTMTWPRLLELDAIGFEFVPEREQSRTSILPKLVTKHGTVVRKFAGMTAKGEWEKYGRSGLSGHTHRMGWFTHRDHNGRANWAETGCTCLLDPPYGVDFDWQQGAVVQTWNADRRIQNVEFVGIRDGSAMWRDREYSPRKKERAA